MEKSINAWESSHYNNSPYHIHIECIIIHTHTHPPHDHKVHALWYSVNVGTYTYRLIKNKSQMKR